METLAYLVRDGTVLNPRCWVRSEVGVSEAMELKQQWNDPVRVCSHLGLLEGYKPKRVSNGIVIRCPAHDDHNPSCSVTEGDNGLRIRCFSCDFRGDLFTLVAQVQGLNNANFPEKLKATRSVFGGSPRSYVRAPSAKRKEPEPTPTLSTVVFANVCEALSPKLKLDGEGNLAAQQPLVWRDLNALGGSKFCSEWHAWEPVCQLDSVGCGLKFRGVLDQAREDGWGELPPPVEEQDCLVRAIRNKFEEASLAWLIRDGRFVHPYHRMLIPWRDPSGAVWNLQRRYAPQLGDEVQPEGVPKYVWPSQQAYNPRKKWVYGSERPELQTAGEIWIAEGAVDALALRALNERGFVYKDGEPHDLAVVAIPGVTLWKAYRESLLPMVRGRKVVIALDADDAGRSAVKAIQQDLDAAGAGLVFNQKTPVRMHRREKRVSPESYKDWGEVAEQLIGYGGDL